jgi:hypothetical protein
MLIFLVIISDCVGLSSSGYKNKACKYSANNRLLNKNTANLINLFNLINNPVNYLYPQPVSLAPC